MNVTMANSIADLLDGLNLFVDFSYPELGVVGRYMMPQSAKKGEIIFHEGDPGNFMLILTRGSISILKGGENGQQLLSCEGRGRIVGEMALLDRERRSATCVVDSDCEYLSFNQDGLRRLAAEYPLLAYRFMFCLAQILSRRLRRTSGMMADFLGDSAENG
ncbi:MAG: cyclic nucleotide-binding domain-containing protein [Sterolibacterium sp.]